ncbi:E3 ubiquitin-protein ligase PDZRN3 [Liparis tanakae]|uniref:E3 ubiquitin-protein ligase PDZRN3 n=1 Tax=Liparis tanakae TaxID=230148 RepID=A0A4Z2I2G9_9TELE|nr:E3 ubiquitin-protein ligase PDZRN3 [Liparis tanakae]
MESQGEPEPGHRAGAVCRRGCGLPLSREELDNEGEHCCVDALRTATDALEEKSATLEHETRMARLRWNRREQSLLARVSTLQNEARLSALRYQRRLHQHMLHISGIAEQVTGYRKRNDVRKTDVTQSQISDTATCAEGAPEAEGVKKKAAPLKTSTLVKEREINVSNPQDLSSDELL